MKSNFILKESFLVPISGQPVRVGYPVTEYMYVDIVIQNVNSSFNFLELNSKILREALLADPETTKRLLGLDVKPYTEKPVNKPNKKKKEVDPELQATLGKEAE